MDPKLFTKHIAMALIVLKSNLAIQNLAVPIAIASVLHNISQPFIFDRKDKIDLFLGHKI